MITPVSFRSTVATSASSFEDKIKQPQTYVVKEDPSAASSIKSSEKKGKAGKVLGGAVIVAALATALGVLAHKGNFSQWAQGAEGLKKTLLTGLDTVGKFIADKAIFVKDKVSEFVKDIPSKLEKLKPKAKDAAEAAAEAV